MMLYGIDISEHIPDDGEVHDIKARLDFGRVEQITVDGNVVWERCKGPGEYADLYTLPKKHPG